MTNMYLFINRGIRGCMSELGNRHTNCNNSYAVGYDHETPTAHILWIDANNLCGCVLNLSKPTGAFQWVVGATELTDSKQNRTEQNSTEQNRTEKRKAKSENKTENRTEREREREREGEKEKERERGVSS